MEFVQELAVAAEPAAVCLEVVADSSLHHKYLNGLRVGSLITALDLLVYNPMFKVLILWVFATLALAVIHVEPERSVQSVSIRIGEAVEISYPNFPFKDIYEKDIKRFPDEKRMFNIDDICEEHPSELILDSLSFFDVKPARPPKAVVYELEDMYLPA